MHLFGDAGLLLLVQGCLLSLAQLLQLTLALNALLCDVMRCNPICVEAIMRATSSQAQTLKELGGNLDEVAGRDEARLATEDSLEH
jgi:hypothetical protein